MKWIRLYAEVLNDPKVLMLDHATFRTWINCLLAGSQDDGKVVLSPALSVVLRLRQDHLERHLDRLVEAGLLVRSGDFFHIHNWSKRQYLDNTNERVKAFRERQRRVTCNVTETPPEYRVQSTEKVQSTENAAYAIAPAALAAAAQSRRIRDGVRGSEGSGPPPPPPPKPKIQQTPPEVVSAQPAALRQRVVLVDRKGGMKQAGELIRELIPDWAAADPPHSEPEVPDDPVTEEQLAEVEERMHQQMPPGFPRPGGGDVAELIRLAGGVRAALAVCAKLGSRRERPRSYALFHAIAQDRPIPKRAPPVSAAAPAPEPVCERCGGSGMISPRGRMKPAGISTEAFREQLLAESRPCGCRA